jgi:hypothetical protein
LSAENISGLKGAINFAGGNGGDPVNQSGKPCAEFALKETFTKDELENMTFTIGENGCPTPMCLYKEDQSKVKPIIAMYKEYRDEQKIYQKNSTYFDLWRDRNIYK